MLSKQCKISDKGCQLGPPPIDRKADKTSSVENVKCLYTHFGKGIPLPAKETKGRIRLAKEHQFFTAEKSSSKTNILSTNVTHTTLPRICDPPTQHSKCATPSDKGTYQLQGHPYPCEFYFPAFEKGAGA